MEKQMKINFDNNYAEGGVTYSEWLKDDYWQEQFDAWMQDGNVSKKADGTYSTQDAQYRNSLKGMSELKKYFYNEFIKGQYSSYFSEGGSTDDKHLIAKAIEYITGYSVDTNTIQKEANNYSFKYKSRNVWSTINTKLIDDTIRMHRKSLIGRYAKGGVVEYETKRIVNEAKNQKKNTHFAIHKPTNSIVFSWDYSGYDTKEMNENKEHYFYYDVKDNVSGNVDKYVKYDYAIVQRKDLEKRGIDLNNYLVFMGQKYDRSESNSDTDSGKTGFNDEGTSMVLYHEKNGNFLVPKGQVYLWLYDNEGSSEKLQNEEYDWVFYPYASQNMAWASDFIPPLKRIWTKKFQKDHKGSEHLLGVIKAYLIEENGKKELFIDMMSVNPTKMKKGIMSYMIKELRDTFKLKQDQVTFSDLTEEGKKFVEKKTYADGGGVGDSFLHLYKLTYPDGFYIVESYDGYYMTPKEALEKMRINVKNFKSYKYKGISSQNPKYKEWNDTKDIGYSNTEAWDEVFENDKYSDGGGIGEFPPKGELTNKDNFLLKYEKKGSDYEFFVYKPITKEISGYNQINHVCLNKDCPQKMNYEQFINYLYAELYLDDTQYADGGLTRGEIEDKIAGLRLRIAKTKKQISGYETTQRGKYNNLFQEKVVPLQKELDTLSDLYGKSKYARGGFMYEVQKKGSPSNDMRETMFTAKNLTELKKKIIEKYGTSEGFLVSRRTEQGYYVPVKFENGGEAEKYQIIDKKTEKYYSVSISDGKIKWNDSPDMGYMFSLSDANQIIESLHKIGYEQVEVVKYDSNWWRKKKYEKGGTIYPDLSLQKSDVVNDSLELNEFTISKMKNTFKINGMENTKIIKSIDAVNILRELFSEDTISAYEQAFVLYLNKNNKVIGYYHHSSGGVDGTIMDVQMISGMALKSLAKGVIIAHNHPSENTMPSDADIRISKQLKEALKLFNIQLLDSIILTDNSYKSFADEGLLF